MSSRASSRLAVSPLRDYYAALLALKEEEQTALAEIHKNDPRLLVRRFRRSVKDLEAEAEIEKKFYPSGRTDPPSPPTPVDQIRRTIEFASQLCDRRPRTVAGAKELGFRYVDRELSPLRTTERHRKVARRSLDLLLANAHDRTPVLAELKIRGDKLPYFALVQALMLAAELLVTNQRARLRRHRPAADLAWSEQGPFADIYVLAFDPPARGTYRERSFDAAEEIARRLIEDEVVSRYIRRIAYVDALPKEGKIAFKRRFAFGSGT